MGTTYVVCRDKEEAMAAASAGVLWLKRYWDTENDVCWEPTERHRDAYWVHEVYGGVGWPPEDFAIRVEDEGDNNA